MTTEQEITAIKDRLAQLETGRDETIIPRLDWLRNRFSPTSGYLRAEVIPQLTGDVTHLAGTEPILVAERFEWIPPANGGNGINVIQVDLDETATLIDVSDGPGVLIDIGIVCNKRNGAGPTGASDVYLDVTIDGGTTRSQQFVFADDAFGVAFHPWVVGHAKTAGTQIGGSFLDALRFPFHISYGTSLKAVLRSENAAGYDGEYDLTGIVNRGILVS